MKYQIIASYINEYMPPTYVCCVKEHWYSSWKSANVKNELQLTPESFRWKEYKNVEDAIKAVEHIFAVKESRSKYPIFKVFDKGVWPPNINKD